MKMTKRILGTMVNEGFVIVFTSVIFWTTLITALRLLNGEIHLDFSGVITTSLVDKTRILLAFFLPGILTGIVILIIGKK